MDSKNWISYKYILLFWFFLQLLKIWKSFLAHRQYKSRQRVRFSTQVMVCQILLYGTDNLGVFWIEYRVKYQCKVFCALTCQSAQIDICRRAAGEKENKEHTHVRHMGLDYFIPSRKKGDMDRMRSMSRLTGEF